jgi:hypothetical protein
MVRRVDAERGGGLIAASVAFGVVHLWFRAFPNWRFALLAAVAECFTGWLFVGASIRASMVTHAGRHDVAGVFLNVRSIPARHDYPK